MTLVYAWTIVGVVTSIALGIFNRSTKLLLWGPVAFIAMAALSYQADQFGQTLSLDRAKAIQACVANEGSWIESACYQAS